MLDAIALRHVAFEDAGLIGAAVTARGGRLTTLNATELSADEVAGLAPDLLIVLGGPIGVGEEDAYPFVRPQIDLVARRMARDLPTLGVCLGAQMMARALGAEVSPGAVKEIGYAPLTLTKEGENSVLSHLKAAGNMVLHWHGDVMAPPPGARVLASTPACPVQAFAVGRNALALQFHVEVTPRALEAWLVGHAVEIAATPGVSAPVLRDQARRVGHNVADAGAQLIDAWLDAVTAH